jgi:thioredoxin 1
MTAITLTEANFEREVNQSALPVLVGFGSVDNIDNVSERMGGALKCCKAAPALADKYKIRTTPTMLLFKNGCVTDTIVGAVKTEQLLKILR